ncbi:MAG TPA: hypothetical protein VF581_10825 [Flavobacterium sp.]|jgi:hypothetical protein
MRKSTIKGLLLAALSVFFTVNVNAQDAATASDPENYDQGFRLGFGANIGYVFDDPYELALGADVRLQYDLSQRYSFTLTTGFTNLFAREYEINGFEVDPKDLGFIPVKVGFKGFIWEDSFYLLGEVGAGFAVTNRDEYEGTNDTTLILAPGIGYANKYFDLSLRYEHYSDFPTANFNSNGTIDEGTGQLALRVAYGFKL